MYNHKRRRQIEKESGLFHKYRDMTESEKKLVRNKKMEVGKQIHLRNIQESEHARTQAEAEREAKILQNLISSGKSAEEAELQLRKNREISEKRNLKLMSRREKQKNTK